MKHDIILKNGIIIPEHELEFSTSRSGGAGGQHVNKTDSRITVRWNIHTSHVFSDELKQRLLQNLASKLTHEGDLIVHNSESRSQHHNKEAAVKNLAQLLDRALYVPKKRMKTKVSKGAKEARLQQKSKRSEVKRLRKVSFD